MGKTASLVIGACIFILVSLNVFMSLKLVKIRESNEALLEVLNDEDIQSQSTKIEMLKSDQLFMIGSNGLKIGDQISIFDDQSREMILDNLCGKEKKFIFRYSYLNCGTCVDALIPYVKSLSVEIGGRNVIFLASYTNDRDLHIFKRVNQIRESIYNMESLPIPLDSQNLPYCFVLEKDKTISHLFIPRKEMLTHAERYFDMIRDYFAQQN